LTGTVVVSGVSLLEMGPLAVMKDALRTLAREHAHRFCIIALVHQAALFEDVAGVKFIEYPRAKRSWAMRLYYEFVCFHFLSLKVRPVLWLSMHDITPNVVAQRRAVYCHNPSPFYDLSVREVMLDPTFALFNMFYEYLYGFNIRKNDFVIVQQQWLRAEFQRRFGLQRNVIVAHPLVDCPGETRTEELHSRPYRFFYPCFPRVFKNVETLLRAVERLQEIREPGSFRVTLSFDGNETRYARSLRTQFAHLHTVDFAGLMSREEVYRRYWETDCLVFASKLETWGLPITEFKPVARPMLVVDKPYAHETVGDYRRAVFFPADDPIALSDLMANMMDGTAVYSRVQPQPVTPPFAGNWSELFSILLDGLPGTNRGSQVPPMAAASVGP
jgi:glycosyltransferase involved in cell wall biosynthesis